MIATRRKAPETQEDTYLLNELAFSVGVLLPRKWQSDHTLIPIELVHQLSSIIDHQIESLKGELPLYMFVEGEKAEEFRSFLLECLEARPINTQRLADIPIAGYSGQEIVSASHLVLVLVDQEDASDYPAWWHRLQGKEVSDIQLIRSEQQAAMDKISVHESSMAVMDAINPLVLISRQLKSIEDRRRQGTDTDVISPSLMADWCRREEIKNLRISDAVLTAVFGSAVMLSLSPILPSTIPLLLVLAAIGLANYRQPWREAAEKWWCIGSLCLIQKLCWKLGLEARVGNSLQLPFVKIDLPRPIDTLQSMRRKLKKFQRKHLGNQLLVAHNTSIISMGTSVEWGAAELDDLEDMLERLVSRLQRNQNRALFQTRLALMLGFGLGITTLLVSLVSQDKANHLIALLFVMEAWLLLGRPVPVMTVARRRRALSHLALHLRELRELRRIDGMTSNHRDAEHVRELMERIGQEWHDLIHDSICSSTWA